MRHLIAVVLMLVGAAVPAHANGTSGQFSGSAIVPPFTGTTVPPFNGTIVPGTIVPPPFTGARRGTRFSRRDFGSLGYIEGPAAESYAPPGVDFIEPGPPASSTLPAELPPCHEMTSVGVVIERGSACSRVAR
jgi:hypothetical protein